MRCDVLNESSGATNLKSKVVTLAAADITLTEEDSGKVFIVSQSAAHDITLPATSITGWNAKFIVGTAGANDVDIVAGTADTMKGLELSNTAVAIDAADKCTFVASNAIVGEYVEVISDGTSLWTAQFAVAANAASSAG